MSGPMAGALTSDGGSVACCPHTQDLLVAAQSPHPGLAVGCAVNALVYVTGIKVLLKGLTWPGVTTSWVLGSLSYAGGGLASRPTSYGAAIHAFFTRLYDTCLPE